MLSLENPLGSPFDIQCNKISKRSSELSEHQRMELEEIMLNAIMYREPATLWLACYYVADVNARENDGRALLMIAIEYDSHSPSTIAILLSFGTQVKDMKGTWIKDNEGRTMLYYGLKSRSCEAVNLLLEEHTGLLKDISVQTAIVVV